MNEKPQILVRVYDFMLYLVPQVAKFPKNQRYNLGERIEKTTLDVFEKIVEALYSKDKAQILQVANINVEKIRLLVRLAKDLKLVNLHCYEVMSKLLYEIGVELGAWIKQQKAK